MLVSPLTIPETRHTPKRDTPHTNLNFWAHFIWGVSPGGMSRLGVDYVSEDSGGWSTVVVYDYSVNWERVEDQLHQPKILCWRWKWKLLKLKLNIWRCGKKSPCLISYSQLGLVQLWTLSKKRMAWNAVGVRACLFGIFSTPTLFAKVLS